MTSQKITVIGGGLAGVEAANVAAMLEVSVGLYEMRPTTSTPNHQAYNFDKLFKDKDKMQVAMLYWNTFAKAQRKVPGYDK